MDSIGRPGKLLRYWVSVDLDNLLRIRTGIQSFSMPCQYRTNGGAGGGWVTQGIAKAEDINPVLQHVGEAVGWLSSQLYRRGDVPGAARCAILLRHFFQDPRPSVAHDCELHTAINRAMRVDGYQFVGVDELNGLIDQRLANLPAGGSSGPARS